MKGYWARTIRKCPPFCLKPIEAAPGVKTVGEVEVFQFMKNQLRNGTGVLIDARTPDWYRKETIPGSVNIPFTTFDKEPDSLEVEQAFELFGVVPRDESEDGFIDAALVSIGLREPKPVTEYWDFSNAKELLLWCNGPHCGQSRRAIRGLIKLGYPADKLYYYRGGMQLWKLWGLSTVVPEMDHQRLVENGTNE